MCATERYPMRLKTFLLIPALMLAACPDAAVEPSDVADGIVADVNTDTADIGGDTADTADTGADTDTATDTDTAETVVPNPDRAKVLSVNETDTFTIPGLTAPVQVLRVEANVPHIYAENRGDLGRALGFVVARDRWLIMDLQRRLGRGTLGALLGDFSLENDMEARYHGFADTSQKVFDSLSPANLAYITAFCEGVNAYVDYAKAGTLPVPAELELFATVLGFATPGEAMVPFEPIDVAAMVAVIMYETNFETGDPGQGQRTQTYEAGGFFDGAPDEALRYAGAQQLWDRFAPPFPIATANTLGLEKGTTTPDAQAASGGSAGAGASSQAPKFATNTGAQRRPVNAGVLARSMTALANIEKRLYRDAKEGFGSNAWAVGGYASTDGSALVAGDGHLPLSMPALFFQVGMNDQVFGEGETHQVGMLLTSLPLLAVGTNGKVAWSQVNPVTDNTDWYREELQLAADGTPTHTFFKGAWEPVVTVTESYVIADVPLFGSIGRTETWDRYQTFDGRRITSIEGVEYATIEEVPADKKAVNIMGKLIVPGDEDGDSKITALSYDWAGFDSAGYVFALDAFGYAEDVEEMRTLHTGQIGGGLYTAAGDSKGNILFSSYQALPCRTYLERNADGTFIPGANPMELLDGTVYGGFTIPTDGDGLVDEGPGATDPYKCVVPLDATPQALNPDRGYVVTANNQPGPITNDGELFNDPYYLGGMWSSIRADSIATGLADHITAGTMDLAAMQEVQAHKTSRTATMLGEGFITAIANAQQWAAEDGPIDPWQQRAVDIYLASDTAFDEVHNRMTAWRDRGYQAASGVETFYNTPNSDDIEDSIATMIWNAWMPRGIQRTFNDETMDVVWRWHGSRQRLATLMRMLTNRGPGNAAASAHYNPATEESVYFDDRQSVDVERSDEVLLAALTDALGFLSGPVASDGESGGFDTTDMTQWLWGLRHQTRFESLLAEFLGDDPTFGAFIEQFNLTTEKLPLAQGMEAGDPRGALTWFPRPGDNYGVDAANPGFSGTKFTHGSGPVMRMVISLKDGEVKGENIIPGGQSMLTESDFYSDQAEKWLANDTFPMRFYVDDVVAGATGREVLLPAPPGQ